jgi:hypothetical protein
MGQDPAFPASHRLNSGGQAGQFASAGISMEDPSTDSPSDLRLRFLEGLTCRDFVSSGDFFFDLANKSPDLRQSDTIDDRFLSCLANSFFRRSVVSHKILPFPFSEQRKLSTRNVFSQWTDDGVVCSK